MESTVLLQTQPLQASIAVLSTCMLRAVPDDSKSCRQQVLLREGLGAVSHVLCNPSTVAEMPYIAATV
jgi:hypothetical protein